MQPALEVLLGEGATGAVGSHCHLHREVLGCRLSAMATAGAEPAGLGVRVGQRDLRGHRWLRPEKVPTRSLYAKATECLVKGACG